MVLGCRHPATLTAMANLAHTWKSQGRNEDAIAMMIKVEGLQKQILSIDHPDTMNSSKTVKRWLEMDVDDRAE
jgi:hypothetical protein